MVYTYYGRLIGNRILLIKWQQRQQYYFSNVNDIIINVTEITPLTIFYYDTKTETITIRLRKRIQNDANLPNEYNIKTIVMPSETNRNENVSNEMLG